MTAKQRRYSPRLSRRKPLAPSEHQIQAAFAEWCATDPLTAIGFAIPNGGARNAITGAMLKSEGARRGIPDYFFPIPSGEFHGLAIEFKRPRGVISTDQHREMKNFRITGYRVAVCYSLAEAIAITTAHISCIPPEMQAQLRAELRKNRQNADAIEAEKKFAKLKRKAKNA